MTRILVIEDEAKMRKLLSVDLELEGFTVLQAKDGVEGLEMAKREKPDLIVLDVMMPKMNGYEVCRTLRKEACQIPIMILTAKGQESEKVVGLELGADDYVTKPFGSLELMARIKALLRRHQREIHAGEKAEFDGIHVDFRRMKATKDGKPLPLTTKEIQILELLLRNKGKVVSRQIFLEQVWGYEEMPSTRTVDNQVLTLRQKLWGRDYEERSRIITIHGVGYKFVD